MIRNNLNFVSNNVKGLQGRDKRIKLFEYLKNCISSNGFVFLQETHSSLNVEKKWADEFKGQLFFSHGKTNSCVVAIGYVGNKPCSLIIQIKDNHGRLLVLEVKIDSEILILINIYNANTESEQLSTLTQLNDMLINVKNVNNKNIILGEDFNMHFDSEMEAKGGKPVLKKQSIAKIVELLENFDLCDIWHIRNLKKRRFTFRQNHFSGYIQRRLDYFFVSNSLQEAIKNVDILASFSTDHSPIIITLSKLNEFTKGKGLWKFNNSLISNEHYVEKMKNHIYDILNFLNNKNSKDDQVIWEYLKYEIRKFTIQYSKRLAKTLREERECLERKLKILEQNSESNLNNNPEYYECKTQPEDIYQIQVDGIRTRSKCMWYEFDEKSFFFKKSFFKI